MPEFVCVCRVYVDFFVHHQHVWDLFRGLGTRVARVAIRHATSVSRQEQNEVINILRSAYVPRTVPESMARFRKFYPKKKSQTDRRFCR